MDRFNRDIVDLALSLEDGEVVELHSFMHRAFPFRKVSERYKHGNYHTNAEAIVLSTWANRKAYIMCGTPGYAGVPSCCHQTLVCEACCKKAAARMYVRYQHSFNKALNWYSLTYSFKTNIFLDSATQEEFLERYKVADRFIRSLRTSGLIQGAVAVREISINSFHGKAVFPHTHVVANSDRADLINEDGTYHASIAEEAERAGVSIKLTRIEDSNVFLTQLKYPLKPINIKALYEQEAINYSYNEINLGLDITLARLTSYGKGTPRIVYYGNMDARCKDYMGEDMNQNKKAKRALARQQQSSVETKELNSAPTPTKMVTVQLDPATTTIMPFAPQQVMPPQTRPLQKKKNFWGPLALGLGAGVAGLGAYDHFANQGRMTGALANHIKKIFSPSSQPAPNPSSLPSARVRRPVTLGPARTEGDVIADAAAGHIGGGVNAGAQDMWKDWIGLQKDVASETAFSRVPGQIGYQNGVATPLAQGVTPDRLGNMLTTPDGRANYASTFLKYNDPGTLHNVVDRVNNVAPLALFGTDLGLLGMAGAGTASGLASKGIASAGLNLPKVTGALGRISSVASKPVFGLSPHQAGTIARGTALAGGGASGYSMGANPLTVEAWMDKFPDMSPEAVAAMTKSTHAAGGAAVAGRIPILGNLALAEGNGLLNRAEGQIRGMSGSVAERGALGDIVNRLYRGTRSGNPQYRNALETVLKYVDENKQLSGAIAGKQNPWYKRWPVWEDNDGSPALQSLINKSRQAIIQ